MSLIPRDTLGVALGTAAIHAVYTLRFPPIINGMIRLRSSPDTGEPPKRAKSNAGDQVESVAALRVLHLLYDKICSAPSPIARFEDDAFEYVLGGCKAWDDFDKLWENNIWNPFSKDWFSRVAQCYSAEGILIPGEIGDAQLEWRMRLMPDTNYLNENGDSPHFRLISIPQCIFTDGGALQLFNRVKINIQSAQAELGSRLIGVPYDLELDDTGGGGLVVGLVPDTLLNMANSPGPGSIINAKCISAVNVAKGWMPSDSDSDSDSESDSESDNEIVVTFRGIPQVKQPDAPARDITAAGGARVAQPDAPAQDITAPPGSRVDYNKKTMAETESDFEIRESGIPNAGLGLFSCASIEANTAYPFECVTNECSKCGFDYVVDSKNVFLEQHNRTACSCSWSEDLRKPKQKTVFVESKKNAAVKKFLADKNHNFNSLHYAWHHLKKSKGLTFGRFKHLNPLPFTHVSNLAQRRGHTDIKEEWDMELEDYFRAEGVKKGFYYRFNVLQPIPSDCIKAYMVVTKPIAKNTEILWKYGNRFDEIDQGGGGLSAGPPPDGLPPPPHLVAPQCQ